MTITNSHNTKCPKCGVNHTNNFEIVPETFSEDSTIEIEIVRCKACQIFLFDFRHNKPQKVVEQVLKFHSYIEEKLNEEKTGKKPHEMSWGQVMEKFNEIIKD